MPKKTKYLENLERWKAVQACTKCGKGKVGRDYSREFGTIRTYYCSRWKSGCDWSLDEAVREEDYKHQPEY